MSIYDKASLVLIPSGTKTSKVYSQKPVNGDGDFTFSRSTAATRVNADGVIEKETQNLLLQSNTFDTTWLNSNSSETSGQIGYDGTNNAWLITKTDANGRIFQTISFSGVNTISFYAKANASDWVRVFIDGASIDAFFDLQNGIIGNTSGSGFVDANIELIANDWYRCSLTISDNATRIRIYPSEANTSAGTSGSIYIQDAQLEQGLVARDYIETTTTAVEGGITDNVPRLDYTDSSCPALLLEPQRRNILPHSEYLGGFTTTRSSIDFGHTSPEGLDNAYKLVSDSTAGASHLIRTQNITITASTDYTTSVFVKAEEVDWVALMFTDTSVQDFGQAWFNISNGTKGISSDGGSATISDYDIIDVGNGWYRIYIVVDLGGDTTCQARLYLAEGDNDSVWNGDGTSGAYIYGFQIEDNGAGGGTSYHTSYIPTYGSAVTRNVEKVDGQENASSYNDSEGVLFVEFSALSATRDNEFRFMISDGSNEERIQIGLQTDGDLYASVIKNNSAQASFDYTLPNPTQTHKVAIKYKANDCALWVDGVERGTDINATMPSGLDVFDFYRTPNNNNYVEANVNQVLYFPATLTDTELADLTTL